MYIYLYTGPQLRLRKARSQRDSVPGGLQRIRSFSVGEGEVRRGLGPGSEITRPWVLY